MFGNIKPFFIATMFIVLSGFVVTAWTYEETGDEIIEIGDWQSGDGSTYDGDWTTGDEASGGDNYAYLHVNYTYTGTLHNAEWQVCDGDNFNQGGGVCDPDNLTVPTSCKEYEANKLIFKGESYEGSGGGFICLSPDTKVNTKEGTKLISDIKAGDMVYSHNNKLELNKVISVNSRSIVYYWNKYYYIYYDYDRQPIKATYNHYFYIDGDYVMAEDLRVGDKLLDYSLNLREIINISVVPNYYDFVWDISVEHNHNFFANNILVHNADSHIDWACYDGSWQSLRQVSGNPITFDEDIVEEGLHLNITEAGGGDTCSCPAINNDWEIDLSDNCFISDDCELGTGTLNFIGSGTLNINAEINTTNLGVPPSNEIIFLNESGKINIR